MPELPEVETVRRGLEPVFSGQTLHKIELLRPDLRVPFPPELPSVLTGAQCLGLRRRGKYILADFQGDQTLVIHLGMSGSFRIEEGAGTALKHDHVRFSIQEKTVTYNDPRRFGMMFLVPTQNENAYESFAKMGPEPLGNAFSGPVLIERLNGRQAPIKPTLLDQKVVAGVGNIYACEALYRSKISPYRRSDMLGEGEAEDVVKAIKAVLNEAIASGGSSLRDHKQTDGSMGYFQHHFDVYDHEGENCKHCGSEILRVTQAGRSTFYCQECQT